MTTSRCTLLRFHDGDDDASREWWCRDANNGRAWERDNWKTIDDARDSDDDDEDVRVVWIGCVVGEE